MRATLATTVPAGGRIIVTLPSVMSVSTSSTLTCTFAEPTSVAVATCAYVGNVITATLSTTALPNSFFQLNIASVVNPPSTTLTSSFQLQTQDSSGNLLDSQTSNIFLSATAGTLASTTLTPTSQVVGATTTLTVSITTAHTVLANGKIKVTFPKWNSQATISSDILSMIETGFSVTAVTNLNSGISATFTSDVLTVTGGFTTDLAAGSVISFSVTNFKNPITTSTFSGFTIATTDSSDGTIDSASATMRITTPTSIYDTSFASKDTTEVQEKAVFRLQFKIPVPLNSGCIMDITFPSDFTLNGADLTTVQGFGLFGGARVLTGSLNVGNNTYTISDGCDGYVSQDIIGILDFNSVENPFSIKPTGSVSIYVKDSSQFSVAQITAGITYTATVGTLTGVTLTPENTVVATSTSITMTFLPAHSLIADETRIEITLPSDVSITAQSNPSTCSISDLKFISPTVQCTVISNTITLIDPFSVAYTPTSTEVLGFKISGMTMPASLKPPGAVVITTKVGTTTFYSVDTVSVASLFVATVGSISEYSITPTSFVAYALTTYTFTFRAQNAILQNGYITVDYPSQISIPNTSTAAASCASVSGFQTTISCSISGSKITVSNGFQTSNLAAGTQVSFSMGNIRSPVSTQTTSSFTYTTFDSSNYQIDTRSSGITVTMTSVNDLQSASVSLGSSVNGATTAYTFTIVASSPLINGDKIYIRVPSTITPSSSPTCTGVTALASSLTCNTLNREILVTLAFSSGSTLTAGSTLSFSIANFQNPSSTLPSDALTFQAQDSTGALINAYTSATAVRVTTTTPATITTASVSNENQLASQSTTMNVHFTTVHILPLNGIIIITYPTEVSPFDSTVTTVTCSLNIATSPTCTHNAAGRTITISNIITTTALAAGTAVEVTLNEMKNPSTATATSTFTIATYEVSGGSNYIIDQVTSGLTITVDCNYPCRSCSADKSECTACLPDSSGNTLLLQTTTTGSVTSTTCVSSCNADYVNINSVCQPCLANCGACLATNRSSCTK